jgi:SAM-dependent methyltransferase
MRDSWTVGAAYEDFMGRWSRRLATDFVSWLRIPCGVHWLDVGCGTGALANAICSHADPASVVACDPAEPFIEFAQSRSPDARLSFVAAGVGGLPRRPGGYGSIASLLALNFFPDPQSALEEMRNVAASQASVSACVWDYSGRMEFLPLLGRGRDTGFGGPSARRRQAIPALPTGCPDKIIPLLWSQRCTLRSHRAPNDVCQLS